MAAKVFLCYRRDDSAAFAGRVQDRLDQELGRDLLFMDVDAIPLGVNFVTALHEAVAKCEVLLAVIGPNWLEARDEAGARRLDDPNDFVRIEIGAALQRSIPVIPILLDGANVPRANQLPEDLKELAMRNWLEVRHVSFHSDLDKLVRNLKARLGKADADKGQTWKEDVRRASAERGAQLRAQLEQRPQPPVKPWLLPAIGAIAASLPAALLTVIDSYYPVYIALVVEALYGGAAGMLVPRFGILKAIAIPIIPGAVLAFVLLAAIGLVQEPIGLDVHQLQLHAAMVGGSSVWGIMLAWLAFWLHSRWVRKQRMN
jgi:hypothetical protein